MHAIIITGSLSHDGTTADVAGLASYLRAQGHDIELLALKDTASAARKPKGWGKLLRLPHPSNSPLTFARYLHHLSRLRCPETILVTSDSPAAMLAATVYQRTVYLQKSHPRLVFLASSLSRSPRIRLRSTADELLALAATRRITAMLVRSAAAVIATGEDIAQELKRRHGAYACNGKLQVIRHWCANGRSPAARRPDHPLARKLNIADEFVIVHHGLYGPDHDVAALAQAIDLTSTDRGTVWLFAGNGPGFDQLRRRHGERKLCNVRYLPPDAACSPADLLSIGDAHLISQGAQLTGTVSTPRLAQIMAARKPAIVIAPAETDCATLARDSRAGFIVPPGRGEVLARCIWQLRDSPIQRQVFARAGRFAYERQLSPDVAYPKLMGILTGEDQRRTPWLHLTHKPSRITPCESFAR